MFTRADLNLAEMPVAEAEKLVAEQERRVAELYLAGVDSTLANELLETFRDSLTIKERDRDLIMAALTKSKTQARTRRPVSSATSAPRRKSGAISTPDWQK